MLQKLCKFYAQVAKSCTQQQSKALVNYAIALRARKIAFDHVQAIEILQDIDGGRYKALIQQIFMDAGFQRAAAEHQEVLGSVVAYMTNKCLVLGYELDQLFAKCCGGRNVAPLVDTETFIYRQDNRNAPAESCKLQAEAAQILAKSAQRSQPSINSSCNSAQKINPRKQN